MKHVLWSCLLLCCWPLLAYAGAERPATSVWLGASALSFHYEESDTSGILDREKGWVPGIHAGIERDFGRWFASAQLDWFSGRVDYTSGSGNTTTDTELRRLELDAGLPVLAQGDGERISLLAGLGAREWRRDIRDTAAASGLDETYRWAYGVLGLRGDRTFGNGSRLVMDALLTRTINPDIRVNFHNGYDSLRLDLGERNGYRLALTFEQPLGSDRWFWVAPWYEYWEIGPSANAVLTAGGVPVGTVSEPYSETRNYGINLGLRWQFR